MKKIIWLPLIVVVLVAAWLGATWYTGTRVEAEIKDRIAFANESWAKDAETKPQIKTVSYERGLFSTHAHYVLTADQLPPDQAPEIDVTIWHGPFPHGGLALKQLEAHTELVPSGAFKTMASALHGKPPLVMDMNCSYGGHCTGTGGVPAIDFALGKSFQLAFGGVQMQFDVDWRSETDYKVDGSAQFLPLTINNQSFGSGQWTVKGDAQNVHEALAWKTDQGESKLTLALATIRPMSRTEFAKLTSQEEMLELMAKNIKTASLNVALSKPMIVDLTARATSLFTGADPAAVRQQASAQFDASLANIPQARQLLRVQGDAITSDWQYADGKLSINGQDNPEMLAQITNGIQMVMKQRAGAAPVAP